jgi:mRNA interferase HigB
MLDGLLIKFINCSMKIIGQSVILTAAKKFVEIKDQLWSIKNEFKAAEWKNPHEILARYASADQVGNRCYVFNIKGNKYRMVVKFNFDRQVAHIKWIGTHSAYSRLDVRREVC